MMVIEDKREIDKGDWEEKGKQKRMYNQLQMFEKKTLLYSKYPFSIALDFLCVFE